jgi:hypothetical protein
MKISEFPALPKSLHNTGLLRASESPPTVEIEINPAWHPGYDGDVEEAQGKPQS